MTDLQQLPETELKALAHNWRAEALRGVREARGVAHAYEAELRRRFGTGLDAGANTTIDLRPLADRADPEPWWKFW